MRRSQTPKTESKPKQMNPAAFPVNNIITQKGRELIQVTYIYSICVFVLSFGQGWGCGEIANKSCILFYLF